MRRHSHSTRVTVQECLNLNSSSNKMCAKTCESNLLFLLIRNPYVYIFLSKI